MIPRESRYGRGIKTSVATHVLGREDRLIGTERSSGEYKCFDTNLLLSQGEADVGHYQYGNICSRASSSQT